MTAQTNYKMEDQKVTKGAVSDKIKASHERSQCDDTATLDKERTEESGPAPENNSTNAPQLSVVTKGGESETEDSMRKAEPTDPSSDGAKEPELETPKSALSSKLSRFSFSRSGSSEDAWRKVKHVVRLSVSFRSLRDMVGEENYIDYYQDLEMAGKIGEGQFAVVEKAKVKSSGIFIAIKKLKPEYLNTVELENFSEEIKLLKKLSHPNIAKFRGTGTCPPPGKRQRPDSKTFDNKKEDQTVFLALDLQGCNLDKVLIDEMSMKWRYDGQSAINWALDISRALNYLHTSIPMVIHRDLKAANILLSHDLSIATISDFGLCKMIERKPKLHQTECETYSMTGQTGTIRYMAPEVCCGKKYNEKVDIYSLAVILWEIFQKERMTMVFIRAGASSMEKYEEMVCNGYRAPIPDKWPEELKELVTAMWSRDPLERPSAREVVDRLEALKKSYDFNKLIPNIGPGCSCNIM